jgi:hypothetical protein
MLRNRWPPRVHDQVNDLPSCKQPSRCQMRASIHTALSQVGRFLYADRSMPPPTGTIEIIWEPTDWIFNLNGTANRLLEALSKGLIHLAFGQDGS